MASAAKSHEEDESIVLSARDSQMVMEALQHPEPAGAALQHAAERHRALIGDDE